MECSLQPDYVRFQIHLKFVLICLSCKHKGPLQMRNLQQEKTPYYESELSIYLNTKGVLEHKL